MDNFNDIFKWIRAFYEHFRTLPDRRVVLLLYNRSSHGTTNIFPALTHTQVVHFPRNTTSKVHPFDSGIITAAKVQYLFYQMEKAHNLQDASISKIYKLDILSAMRALKRIWNEMEKTVIYNCWMHTGLLDNVHDAEGVTPTNTAK